MNFRGLSTIGRTGSTRNSGIRVAPDLIELTECDIVIRFRQPVASTDMRSAACVAHWAEYPDGLLTLYSAQIPLYAPQGTLSEVTGWEEKRILQLTLSSSDVRK